MMVSAGPLAAMAGGAMGGPPPPPNCVQIVSFGCNAVPPQAMLNAVSGGPQGPMGGPMGAMAGGPMGAMAGGPMGAMGRMRM